MTDQAQSDGRQWSIAAVLLYVAILLSIPLTFGASLFLVPVAMVLSTVAWKRDRPSRVRRSAEVVTLVLVPFLLGLLVFHLIWGDLS